MCKIPYCILLIILFINLSQSSNSEHIYTIQYIRNFNRQKISKYLGCNQTTITFGTYLYPMGVKDAMYVYLNQGTYQAYVQCPFKQIYAKIFGTQQNYDLLLSYDPTVIADKVKQSVSRLNGHYIVDWKCPLTKDNQKARNWLNTFVEKLAQGTKVYVKAPASYFCYKVNNQRYLLDLEKVSNFIVQFYGELPGVYTSYEEIFQKQALRQGTDKDPYQQTCRKYPSYKNLVTNNPDKQFFIGKTLLKEQAGYVGPKLDKLIQKAGKLYENRPVFMDSFPDQIIQL